MIKMASFPNHVPFCIQCSNTNISPQESNKHKLHCVKINGTKSTISQALNTTHVDSFYQNVSMKNRQNIPTKKQLVDPYRQGIIVDDEFVGYKQTVTIRSYEVGPDKTAKIDSILNLLQETALNHVWMSGLLSDGYGATHGMLKNNLTWVVSKMQVQIDHYPIWGEVIEIDAWAGAAGKNGMRRDWLLRGQATGLVFARATSTMVMMNQQTRRFSKMPDEVRAELSPWFIEKQAIKEEKLPEKINRLNNYNARYVCSDLKPTRGDLDMNHHVNNVKYLRWMLEPIPDEFLENYQLSNIIIEYRRECGSQDVVQSLCEPQEDEQKIGIIEQQHNHIGSNGNFSMSSEILGENGLLGSSNEGPFSYTHLLQIKGESKDEQILRGKTTWKKKISKF